MSVPILLAIAKRRDDGRTLVLSPLVGIWLDLPHPGALLGPGSQIGLLTHLNRRYRLALPEGAAGRIVAGLPRDHAVAVEYGQLLFELSAIGEAEREALGAEAGTPGHPSASDLPPGTWAVVSPTDGVFYRRPTPAAPPFVEPGVRVRSGDPVGLVEVMKTFNQIVYGGPGFPDQAEVTEIRCQDAAEVRAGQILVVVR